MPYRIEKEWLLEETDDRVRPVYKGSQPIREIREALLIVQTDGLMSVLDIQHGHVFGLPFTEDVEEEMGA